MQDILVFGTGKLYKEKEQYIKDNYNIVGFLDNQVSGSQSVYGNTNIPIYNPQDISQYLTQNVLIVLMSYQYVSMWKQLCELGVEQERILFGVMFFPFTENEEVMFGHGRCLAAEGKEVVYHLNTVESIIVESHAQLQEIIRKELREEYRSKYPIINAIAQMDTRPVSRKFGLERGKAIDRYYIEKFLEENKKFIYGDCLEVAENTYTLQYGEDRVKNAYALHVEGWGDHVIKGNLETGEGIEENQYDCAIITQTLMFIYDIEKVAVNIHKMLRKGGHALITVSGISQISRYDAELWGSYYSFHQAAMKALFAPLFGEENVKIHTYGNVKAAVAMLCGLCLEDLKEDDLEMEDPDYPMIISVVLEKK